jgi:hypothetical protein
MTCTHHPTPGMRPKIQTHCNWTVADADEPWYFCSLSTNKTNKGGTYGLTRGPFLLWVLRPVAPTYGQSSVLYAGRKF